MTEIKNGRRFSSEFEKATEVNEQTMVLIQTPNNPVQKAEVGQIKNVVNKGMIAAEELAKTLENYATIDDSYPKMTVGFAQEIVGDGSATEEEFSFRPTAGEDRNVASTTYYEGERNGVARIEKIKGNTVAWNQKITSITSTTNKDGADTTYDEATDEMIITNLSITSNYTSGSSRGKIYPNMRWETGHVYALFANKNIQGIGLFDETSRMYANVNSVFTAIGSDYVVVRINNTFDWNTVCPVGESIRLKMKLCDLTHMFGAGNEPTTVEVFYERLPKGIDINAYNEGEIVNGNYGAIKTVGFNAFNGTYAKVCGSCPYYLGGNYTSLGFATEEGGTLEAITLPTSTESVGTTPSDRLYTPTQNGYIYAEGENININLSWDTEYGYLNGTYQPYKPFTRDLSWVSKYFPDGMRSAGSARDEIRFNSTTQKWEAVQKVGVVDLGSLSWSLNNRGYFLATIETMVVPIGYFNKISTCSKYTQVSFANIYNGTAPSGSYGHPQGYKQVCIYDSAYTDVAAFKTAMQGVMLNYELAEPIVTEIEENINMDFDVSDYGTEELIVAEGAQSAPLVADIAYAPNALSTIKQVPDILKRLKALESAVAQQTTNVEPSNIEE